MWHMIETCSAFYPYAPVLGGLFGAGLTGLVVIAYVRYFH